MYYVYVIKNDKGIYYRGLTNDLERRLAEHNKGKNISTKNKGPWQLIHAELFNSRVEARKAEKFYKSGFGREIINELFILR